MKNKVLLVNFAQFTAGQLALEVPADYEVYQGSTGTYIGQKFYPETIRITNNSDQPITYNIFESEDEYNDYLRDPTNLYDHIEILPGRRDLVKSISKSVKLNLKADYFTGNIKIEFLDYKFK